MTVAKILKTPLFSYLTRAYRCKTVASLPLQDRCKSVAELYITTKSVSKMFTVARNAIATLFTVALHSVYIVHTATTTTV